MHPIQKFPPMIIETDEGLVAVDVVSLEKKSSYRGPGIHISGPTYGLSGYKWSNPYFNSSNSVSVSDYNNYLVDHLELVDEIDEIFGKVLICDCDDEHTCHGPCLALLAQLKYNMINELVSDTY